MNDISITLSDFFDSYSPSLSGGLRENRLERMNNLTNFITNLSNLGRENTDRDTLRWLAEIGALPYDARGRFKGGA